LSRGRVVLGALLAGDAGLVVAIEIVIAAFVALWLLALWLGALRFVTRWAGSFDRLRLARLEVFGRRFVRRLR